MAEIKFCSEIVDNVKGKVVVMTGIAQHFAFPTFAKFYLIYIADA